VLSTHLINNFSNLYTVRKLSETLDFKSVTTTEKYISYLKEAYLIFSVLRYSPKSVQRIKSPRKAYTVDNGFIAAKGTQHSPDKGRLMENLVFMELVKQGFKPERELFYYKTRNNREVDFVLKKGAEKPRLIQVCYESMNSLTEDREIKPLIEASGELNSSSLTVITWDEEREITQDGKTVQFKPLWKWLLQKSDE
jgi:hypothetical protein